MVFEVGVPDRVKVIQNKKEYIDFVRDSHKIKNLYKTVYNFKYLKSINKPDYSSAIVNKMFFDADSENSLNVVKKFVDYLDKENYSYYLKQSSYDKFSKLQIYVLTNVSELNNKKNALYNGMVSLADSVGLTYGEAHSSDLDKSTFGDLAQLCPIGGTYKPKRNCYCSYISKSDLYDDDKLKQAAKHGNGKKIIYGKRRFDLKPFDYVDNFVCVDNSTIIENDDFDIKFDDKFVDSLPPFIKKVLSNYKGYCDNYINRWRVALYMRDIGYSKSLAEQILKKYYSKYINYSSLEGRGTQWDRFCKCKALHYVFNSSYREFPSVGTLLNEGYEITQEDEKAINNLYERF